mgnify:CR=1 FL=1
MVAIDVDGDGAIDLVLANDGANVLLFNDGKGGFTASSSFPGGTAVARMVAFGDINGDGHMDAVVAAHDDQLIVWYELFMWAVQLVLLNLFNGLYKEGFCTAPPEKEDDAANAEEKRKAHEARVAAAAKAAAGATRVATTPEELQANAALLTKAAVAAKAACDAGGSEGPACRAK